MPDISMCKDKDCPSASRCYRFTATPNDYQWYGGYGETRQGRDKCESFWPVKNEREAQSLDRALE